MKVLFAILIILLSFGTVQAQTIGTNPAYGVATCGTIPGSLQAPTSGSRSYLTVDTNGNLCAGVSVSATIATAGLAISVTTSTTSGTVMTPVGGFVTTAAPTYINGQSNALSLDTSGNLRVAGTISLSQCTSATCTSTVVQPTGTNLHTVSDSGTITTITNPVTVTDGAGALNTIVDSGTITTITNPVTVTGTVTATGCTSSGCTSTVVQPTGTNLHVVTDSGTITTVTTVTGATISNGAGASAVNIQDGGNSITVDGAVTVTNSTTANMAVSADLATIKQTATVTAGVAGLLAVGGAAADNATSSGNPIKIAGDDVTGKTQTVLVTTSGTLATDSTIPVLCPTGYTHVQGRVILSGITTSSVISAVASQFIYIKSAQIINEGATNARISWYTNGTATPIGDTVAPTNTTPFGGSNIDFLGTLQTSVVNKSFDAGASASSTSIYVSVQGCQGP